MNMIVNITKSYIAFIKTVFKLQVVFYAYTNFEKMSYCSIEFLKQVLTVELQKILIIYRSDCSFCL